LLFSEGVDGDAFSPLPILFVIQSATREVQIAGIVPEAHGEWLKQMARQLTDALDGFLAGLPVFNS